MAQRRTIVLSGAPGTGKTTVATRLAQDLGFPLLSLDAIKEALGDLLGTGDEDWSDLVGDAAAEVVFRLNRSFVDAIVEGWWRRKRRERALNEFVGCIEVFCTCDPDLAEERMRFRHGAGRHPIHRDVINPLVHTKVAELVRTVQPLGVGRTLIEIDTTQDLDLAEVVSRVGEALEPRQ